MIVPRKIFAVGMLISIMLCSINISGQSIQNVDTYLKKYLDKVPVPGFSLVIVEDGSVKFSKGYGFEKQGDIKPMSVNTTMAIGAMGRGFTAIAIMQLVEQGLVDLDVPIITYLPWFKTANQEFSDQITLRMCLSNTTGIPPQFEALPDLDNTNSSESFVRTFESHFIKRKPGLSHEFCDEGFVIAGLIVAEVTGVSYADYVVKNILEPLEMKNSAVRVRQLGNRSVVHGHEMGLVECYPAERGSTEGNYVAAGSEFYSSAADLGRYMIALLNKGQYKGRSILSAEGIEELFRSNTSFQGLGTMLGGNGIDIQYALGWMGMNIEDRDIMIHTGNNGNVASIIGLNRDKDQAFAMLFNADVNRLDRFEYPGMEFIVNNVIHIFNNEDTSEFGMMREGIPNMNTFRLDEDKWSKYIGHYESFGRPNPFFKDMNIEVFEGESGEMELIARQQQVFKGHYRLEFTMSPGQHYEIFHFHEKFNFQSIPMVLLVVYLCLVQSSKSETNPMKIYLKQYSLPTKPFHFNCQNR